MNDLDDMSWLDDIEPPKPDARISALQSALAEFRAGPPNRYLRSIVIEERRFIVVGTWRSDRSGKTLRIDGAPGGARSFVGALGSLVEFDLREEHPEGEYRVWMLAHRAGMPLRLWVSIDGRNEGVLHFVLTDDAWRRVTAAEYDAARRAWP
jgi:hypothetical protein